MEKTSDPTGAVVWPGARGLLWFFWGSRSPLPADGRGVFYLFVFYPGLPPGLEFGHLRTDERPLSGRTGRGAINDDRWVSTHGSGARRARVAERRLK